MSTTVHCLSRREIESIDWRSTEPGIAICLAYPNGRIHRVTPGDGLVAVHHTRFSDCDGEGRWTFPENKAGNTPIPMLRGQALDILDFARAHGDVDDVYVACMGGVSRSRGVAAGLCAVLGWDDAAVYAEGQPNAHCKSMIVAASRLWDGRP